jgi:hypothetical protein
MELENRSLRCQVANLQHDNTYMRKIIEMQDEIISLKKQIIELKNENIRLSNLIPNKNKIEIDNQNDEEYYTANEGSDRYCETCKGKCRKLPLSQC